MQSTKESKMSFITKKPTVDSVLAVFKKTISDLQNVGEATIREGQLQTQVIQEAEEKKQQANREANRAFAIQSKLFDLIGE
jgi:hypothetical protein